MLAAAQSALDWPRTSYRQGSATWRPSPTARRQTQHPHAAV